jgi:hypothetical protein
MGKLEERTGKWGTSIRNKYKRISDIQFYSVISRYGAEPSCGETMENRRIPTPKIAYHSLKFCIYCILRSIKNRKRNTKF